MKNLSPLLFNGLRKMGLIFVALALVIITTRMTQAGEQNLGSINTEMVCPTAEEPVCGEDGITYLNSCEAERMYVKVRFTGSCPVNEVPAPGGQIDDVKNQMENSRRDYKNRSQELKNNFRQSKVDLSGATAALAQWEIVLNKLQGYVDKGDSQGFWDVQQEEENDARIAVDDAFQEVYAEDQKFQAERNLKDKRRSLKDRDRAIKDANRQKLDVGPLQNVYGNLEACIAKLESYITQPDYDQQEFWDMNRDCDDLDREFWDTNNTFQQAQQRKDIEKQLKDKQKFMKDKERAIEKASRQNNDVSKLQELVGQMQTQLQQMVAYASQPDFDTQTYWDMDRDFNDLEFQFWEIHRTFFEKQDQENMQRNIHDKARMIKDLERECKKNRCSETAKQLIPKLQSLISEMEKAVMNTEDKQTFWDLNSEFDQASQEAWESMREVTEREDMGRWLKDIAREFKNLDQLEKELNRLNTTDRYQGALQNISNMKMLYEKAKMAYESGQFSDARDHLQELNNIRMDLEDLMRDFWEQRDDEHGFKELEFMVKEINRAEAVIKKQLANNKIGQDEANVCLGYIAEGRSLLQKMKAVFESGNEEQGEEIEFQMEALGMKADKDCGQFFDQGHEAEYEAFNEVYVDEDYHDVSQKIFEKVKDEVANKVLDHIKNNSAVFNSILENVGAQFADQVAQALEAATFVPPEFQEELLSRKAALLGQIKEMEELTARLNELKKLAAAELEELNAIRGQLAGYNFIGDAGDEMEEEISAFLEQAQGLTKEQIKEKIKELKAHAREKIQEAKEEKLERGMIAFLDCDDNEWWAGYCKILKDGGFVKGTGESGFTELNPGALTNAAEAVTMFGRLVGVDPNAKPTSKFCQRMPDWARPACAALERRGVDLDKLFGAYQAGDHVTRADVARLLQAVFNLPEGSTPSFADMDRASLDEIKAIGAVSAAGIMTGYEDGSNKFGVDDPLNRAALVKVITKGLELSGGLEE